MVKKQNKNHLKYNDRLRSKIRNVRSEIPLKKFSYRFKTGNSTNTIITFPKGVIQKHII